MRQIIWLGINATLEQGQTLFDGLKSTLIVGDVDSLELVRFGKIPALIGNEGAKSRIDEITELGKKKLQSQSF